MDWRKDLLLVSFERLLIVEHEKMKNEPQGPLRDPLGASKGARMAQNR